MTPKPIRIIHADDHDMFRAGFKRVMEFEMSGMIEFIDEAGNGIELLEKVDKLHPDIVITDIKMPVMDGIQACRVIKSKYPSTRVIAYSAYDKDTDVIDMLGAGANGYLVKNNSKEEIAEAIVSVKRGEHFYCQTISDKVYENFGSNGRRQRKLAIFSIQEIKVIRLICQQLSTKEIAHSLKLSVRTVEDYRHHIFEKTGARNVVGIALYAVINGIVKSGDV